MIPVSPIRLGSQPHIAIVRFSALGDVTLVAAAVGQLRRCLPDAKLTWITSPLAHSLLQGLEGVQFEVFEKPKSLSDYRAFYRAFRHLSFDVVLAMQANLRINLLYPALRAPVKIGFDRTRAREGQGMFCNRAIPFRNEHLLDSFLAFNRELGCAAAPVEWNLAIPEKDLAWAHDAIRNLPRPLLALHPCASKQERNWPLERMEEVILAAEKTWGCGFVFTGGDAPGEQAACARLSKVAGDRGRNLCGLTTPKQLAALLSSVDALIAPDTAAVHLARAMNTPVIGLYAVASPGLSGPYQRDEFSVNRYPDAVQRLLGKDANRIAWNTRVHHPDAMSCIETAAVLQQLSRLLAR